MGRTNKHGLGRHIPAEVRRQVRQRSKFGCVRCRCAIYQLEHIEPQFARATQHDPDAICCLCGSCHDAVTRGQISKEEIAAAYRTIQDRPADEVGPPIGPLDFHTGTAELVVGGLHYNPCVQTLLRYHGEDVIRVVPGKGPGERGAISALFTDDEGKPNLALQENEWIGSMDSWDIDVTGSQLRYGARRGKSRSNFV